MPLATNILNYIEDELREREWQLFGSLEAWTPQQRDHWQAAWRAWRQTHLARLSNGDATMRVWIESNCIACFDCEVMCQEVFIVGEHRSQVRKDCIDHNPEQGPHIKPQVLADVFEHLQMAKMACPVEAIKICISDPTEPEPLPQDFCSNA